MGECGIKIGGEKRIYASSVHGKILSHAIFGGIPKNGEEYEQMSNHDRGSISSVQVVAWVLPGGKTHMFRQDKPARHT